MIFFNLNILSKTSSICTTSNSLLFSDLIYHVPFQKDFNCIDSKIQTVKKIPSPLKN